MDNKRKNELKNSNKSHLMDWVSNLMIKKFNEYIAWDEFSVEHLKAADIEKKLRTYHEKFWLGIGKGLGGEVFSNNLLFYDKEWSSEKHEDGSVKHNPNIEAEFYVKGVLLNKIHIVNNTKGPAPTSMHQLLLKLLHESHLPEWHQAEIKRIKAEDVVEQSVDGFFKPVAEVLWIQRKADELGKSRADVKKTLRDGTDLVRCETDESKFSTTSLNKIAKYGGVCLMVGDNNAVLVTEDMNLEQVFEAVIRAGIKKQPETRKVPSDINTLKKAVETVLQKLEGAALTQFKQDLASLDAEALERVKSDLLLIEKKIDKAKKKESINLPTILESDVASKLKYVNDLLVKNVAELQSGVIETLNTRYGLLRKCNLPPQQWLSEQKDKNHPKISDDDLKAIVKMLVTAKKEGERLFKEEGVTWRESDILLCLETTFLELHASDKKYAGFENVWDFKQFYLQYINKAFPNNFDEEDGKPNDPVSLISNEQGSLGNKPKSEQIFEPREQLTREDEIDNTIKNNPKDFNPVTAFAYRFWLLNASESMKENEKNLLTSPEFRKIVKKHPELGYASLSDGRLIKSLLTEMVVILTKFNLEKKDD